MKKPIEYLEAARKLKKESSAWYSRYTKNVAAEIDAAKGDPRLSTQGRMEKVTELKHKQGIELMKHVYIYHQMMQEALDGARKSADRIIRANTKKPSEEDLTYFNKEYNKLKTNLLLQINVKKATDMLHNFVLGVSDTYFAELIRNDFPELIKSVMSIAGNSKEALNARKALKHSLDSLWEDPSVAEAREILEDIQYMGKSSLLFSPAVVQNASKVFGLDVSKSINNPDLYFDREGFAEHKPEDSNPISLASEMYTYTSRP